MKTILDAYYFAIAKVKELEESGINVEVSKYLEFSKYLDDDSITNKHIPFEKWRNITFKKVTKEQSIKINEMANYLNICGITFDIGGCANNRDWSFDWSFNYKKATKIENGKKK